MKSDHILQDRVAVITGAGQGIGRAIISAFMNHGAHIIAVDTNKKMIQKLLGQENFNGLAIKADVSNSKDISDCVEQIMDIYGRVDILVNNAGIYSKSLVIDMQEDEWDRIINVNLKGTFIFSKAVAQIMINQKYGRIINMSSRAGRQGSKGRAHYAASKAGILGFTMSLARELGPYGITVNALAPGVIRTQMTKDVIAMGEKSTTEFPVGRFGKPEDIIGSALLLASEYGGFITGSVIDVNGGSWMG